MDEYILISKHDLKNELINFVNFFSNLIQMAHHTIKSSYSQLINRINKYPLGATHSKLLYSILEMLFSEKEAKLVALLPIKPFTIERANKIWRIG